MHAQVAQLDRASGYGPEGREFESCLAHLRDNDRVGKGNLPYSFIYVLEYLSWENEKLMRRYQ